MTALESAVAVTHPECRYRLSGANCRLSVNRKLKKFLGFLFLQKRWIPRLKGMVRVRGLSLQNFTRESPLSDKCLLVQWTIWYTARCVEGMPLLVVAILWLGTRPFLEEIVIA